MLTPFAALPYRKRAMRYLCVPAQLPECYPDYLPCEVALKGPVARQLIGHRDAYSTAAVVQIDAFLCIQEPLIGTETVAQVSSKRNIDRWSLSETLVSEKTPTSTHPLPSLSRRQRSGLTIAALCLLAIVVVVSVFLLLRSQWLPTGRRARDALTYSRRLYTTAQQIGFTQRAKQVWTFYQIVAAIPSVYILDLPDDEYTAWISFLEWPSYLGVSLILPSSCYARSYTSQLLIATLWPWALL
eukprot:6189500-Pleurochrysis_carterae.AAC.3